jgi:hypothetical protein
MGSAEGAKDDELIGLQRRYDDEMKRRLVKRVAPKFFKGCTTTILVNDEDVRTVSLQLIVDLFFAILLFAISHEDP